MVNEKAKLYTPAEITLATGVSRQTVRNRAKSLGYNTSGGAGYTVVQVLAIITTPIQLHRKSEENAIELREKLNELIEQEDIPMAIVGTKSGDWTLEYRN